MNTKEQELLQEIKNLSQKISNVNSFSGLMMYQSDIQRLYEDFIFFKKLNESKENAAIANEFQPKKVQQPIMKEDETKPKESLLENGIDSKIEVEAQEEKSTESEVPAPNKVENNQPKDAPLDYNFSIHAGEKPKPIQLDVNDSIAFTNYLFEGDREDFLSFIEQLNVRNKQTSQTLIMHTEEVQAWGKNEYEYVERLKELNNHRFE